MDIPYPIKAIIILGIDGKRCLANYYDTNVNQKSFEKKIFSKTRRTKDEVFVVDNTLVVHKSLTDLNFYVVGPDSENPMLMYEVLCCLTESISTMLMKNVQKQSLMSRLDDVILAMDEMCDGGLLLEIDSEKVVKRVMHKEESPANSMTQLIQSAKELGFSFR